MESEQIISELAGRISRLEKSNRRLTLVASVIAVTFFALITIGAASVNSRVHESVRTRHLEIVSEDGSTIMEMLDDEVLGPMMCVYDHDGNVAVELDAYSAGYGAALRLHDREGVTVMDIGNVRGWGPGFSLRNGSGEERVRLSVYGDDSPRLSFHSGTLDTPITRASIGLIDDGTPELALYDEDGEILFYEPDRDLVD